MPSSRIFLVYLWLFGLSQLTARGALETNKQTAAQFWLDSVVDDDKPPLFPFARLRALTTDSSWKSFRRPERENNDLWRLYRAVADDAFQVHYIMLSALSEECAAKTIATNSDGNALFGRADAHRVQRHDSRA